MNKCKFCDQQITTPEKGCECCRIVRDINFINTEYDYWQAMNSIKDINDEHLLIGLQIEIEAKLLGIRNKKKEYLKEW